MTAIADHTKIAVLGAVACAQGGDAASVHYGLFEPAVANLGAAQRALAAALLEAVSHGVAAPARLGVFGPSAAGLCEQFTSNGDAALKSESVDLFAEGFTPASFDCLLLEGSYRSIDQLTLLSNARQLLVPGGRLSILNEFIEDDSAIEISPLPNLSSCRQLATRLGFNVESERDLSASALRSIMTFEEAARHLMASRMADSSAELSGSPQAADFEQVLAELAFAEREYRSTRRRLRLITLTAGEGGQRETSQESEDSEYARAEYGDKASFAAGEVAGLFEKSFGHAFDEALWHWKYEMGAGRCVAARAERGGELVAHYGGAPRAIRYFGRDALAIQPCDVMVMPERRTRYGKGSLFFKVAATFLEREIGNTVDHLLGFGFPNNKTMRLAIRLGLYEKTDDFVELRYPVPSIGDAEGFTLSDFDGNEVQHREQLDGLWQAMREHTTAGIIGLRDFDYIDYRYLQHPHRGRYSLKWLKDSQGDARALVVYKRHGEAWLLMDLICVPAAASELLGALNQLLASAAQIQGEAPRQLLVWITQGWASQLLSAGATVHDLGIEIPCNAWNPGPPSALLYGKWWLTAGDMDFQ